MEAGWRLGRVNQVAVGLLRASLGVLLLGARLVVGPIHHALLVALLLFGAMAIEGPHVIGLLNWRLPVPGGFVHRVEVVHGRLGVGRRFGAVLLEIDLVNCSF